MLQVTVALCGTIMTINLSAMTSTITIVNGVLLKSESSFNKTNNNSEFSFNKTNNNSTNSDNFPITSAEASLYGKLKYYKKMFLTLKIPLKYTFDNFYQQKKFTIFLNVK